MIIEIVGTDSANDGLVIYREGDYAFDFHPLDPLHLSERTGDQGVSSLGIGSLQIEIGIETRLALFAWGYCPRQGWKEGHLDVPRIVQGQVQVNDQPLGRGVSHPVGEEASDWRTTYDIDSGWVRIHRTSSTDSDQLVEIASGTLLDIRNGDLWSLWLHPTFE
jgi:hypothetical protein